MVGENTRPSAERPPRPRSGAGRRPAPGARAGVALSWGLSGAGQRHGLRLRRQGFGSAGPWRPDAPAVGSRGPAAPCPVCPCPALLLLRDTSQTAEDAATGLVLTQLPISKCAHMPGDQRQGFSCAFGDTVQPLQGAGCSRYMRGRGPGDRGWTRARSTELACHLLPAKLPGKARYRLQAAGGLERLRP